MRQFGRSQVLFTTLVLSGLSFALMPFLEWLPILFVLAIVLGGGLGLGQPLSLVYVLNLSEQARHGEVLGLRLTFNRIAQFTAPVLFGAIGGIGLLPIFLTNGVILMMGAFGTKIKEEPKPTDKQSLS